MARIYANENFPLPVVNELRRLGHDVLTVQEAGRTAESDHEVLAFAISRQRILLTLNRKHSVRLHRLHTSHCGIVVCSADRDYERLAERIHRALSDDDPINGQLVRVDRPAGPA